MGAALSSASCMYALAGCAEAVYCRTFEMTVPPTNPDLLVGPGVSLLALLDYLKACHADCVCRSCPSMGC